MLLSLPGLYPREELSGVGYGAYMLSPYEELLADA